MTIFTPRLPLLQYEEDFFPTQQAIFFGPPLPAAGGDRILDGSFDWFPDKKHPFFSPFLIYDLPCQPLKECSDVYHSLQIL